MSEEDITDKDQSSDILILIAFIIASALFATFVSSCTLKGTVSFDLKDLTPAIELEGDVVSPISM